LSLRSFSRLGSSMSVLDFLHLGSSISLRSFARLGSSVSLGAIGLGHSLSVLDFLHLGSSVSLRSYARIGSALSVFAFSHLGSSISLRSFARLGSTLSIVGQLKIGSGSDGIQLGADFNAGTSGTKIVTSGQSVLVYAGGVKSATFESDGGILHGSWSVESALVTSDRRLKTNIMPLQRTLREVVLPRGEQKTSDPASSQGQRGDGALWLLRQLRPVSYSFRKGADSKSMRFGFIADELDSVVPEVVRRPGDREVSDQKAVVYQDLIALLAAASQSQQTMIETQKSELEQQKSALEQQRKMLETVLEKLTKLEEAKEEKRTKKLRRRRKKKVKATWNETNNTNVTNESNDTFLL